MAEHDGHSVRLVSRGGSGPNHPAIERVAADVPTDRPASLREVSARMARIAGVPDPGVQVLPRVAVRLGGLAVPFLRELPRVRYQFAAPVRDRLERGAEHVRCHPDTVRRRHRHHCRVVARERAGRSLRPR
jgi:hypothetical protein